MAIIEVCFIRTFRFFLQIVSKIWYYIKTDKSENKPLPSISNTLLLESAVSLAEKIRSGEVTSEEVVQAFIDRSTKVMHLSAFSETNFEQALAEAKQVDAYLSENPDIKEELLRTKPFYGVPFTAKDCFQAKGLHQTAGVWSRRNLIQLEDGPPIKRMKNAGGIIIGLTKVPEMALSWETFNPIHGVAVNPYAFDRTPGGSSGGEGAILSAAGSPMGLGSDLAGSIRIPAYYCGIFGHKCSSGITNGDGHFPTGSGVLEELAGIGPMSRFAKDLRPLLQILMDPKKHHLVNFDRKVDLKDLKIFYMEDDGGSPWTAPVDKEIKAALLKTVEHFKTTYHVPCKKMDIPKMKNIMDMYLFKLSGDKTIQDFTVELGNKEKKTSIFKELVKLSVGLSSEHTLYTIIFVIVMKMYNTNWRQSYCKSSLEDGEEMKKIFEDMLEENCIFLFPPQPTAAIRHRESLFLPGHVCYTAIFNLLGLPVTQCPLGLNSAGLPIGVQVVGGLHQDDLCLTVAEEIEKTFGGWVCPSVVSK